MHFSLRGKKRRMKLHTWLAENGKTATWLAGRTGLSISYLSRVIAGARIPSLETCGLIGQATNGAVTANDLVPSSPRKREKKAA